MHSELWVLSLQAERRLWIYLLVHFNILESPVLVQWAPPGLLTLLSCYKNPQSLWTMCLRNMNEARGPYIGCCRSLSISSTVCLCHLAQCTGRNTKQQRVIVEQSASKKKRRWRKMGGMAGWRDGVEFPFSCELLESPPARREAGIIQHWEIIATVLQSQEVFSLLSAKLCILVWSENASSVELFQPSVKTVKVF